MAIEVQTIILSTEEQKLLLEHMEELNRTDLPIAHAYRKAMLILKHTSPPYRVTFAYDPYDYELKSSQL